VPSPSPRDLKAGEEIELRFGPAHHARQNPSTRPTGISATSTSARMPLRRDAYKDGANIIKTSITSNELNPTSTIPSSPLTGSRPYVARAHEHGVKVKIYYTVRELSNRVAEMFPLRSLGYEVFADGGDGGILAPRASSRSLRRRLASAITPTARWMPPSPRPASRAGTTTTLEGLSWLLRNVHIDGLYLDGIGYDREIMKRVRKVMDRARPGCLIDFHSGNEFPFNDLHVSPANKYMEHFPYINSPVVRRDVRLQRDARLLLIEMSGIPFRPLQRDAPGQWQPVARHDLRHDRPLLFRRRPQAHLAALGRLGIEHADMKGYWAPDLPGENVQPRRARHGLTCGRARR